MKPTTHTPETPDTPTPPRHQLRQTIAIGICGGIGGASVFEAVASVWLHPAVTVAQPTAGPLALAGAVLGSAVALFALRRHGGIRASDHARAPAHETVFFAESAPLAPMAWEPGPRYIPYLDEGEPTATFGTSLPMDTLDVCPAPRAPRHTASRHPRHTHPARRVPAQS